MKTLKIKAILFSLLAIIATAFITSCSQMSIEDVTPELTDEAIFRAVLDASKGKIQGNIDNYVIQLSEADLAPAVYEALMAKGTLIINQGFTISAEDVAEIFCLPNGECALSGAYVFGETIELNPTSGDIGLRCWCFPNGICIC